MLLVLLTSEANINCFGLSLCCDCFSAARPTGGSLGMGPPAPYQRGPPQEYLEAVTNKRLTEEVRC